MYTHTPIRTRTMTAPIIIKRGRFMD